MPDPAPRVPRKAQYEERFLREETVSQQVNAIELLRTRPLAPPEARRPQRPLQRRVLLRGRPASRPTVIRGVTYYKAKEPEEENDIEEQRESGRGAPGRGGQGPPRSHTEGAVLRPRELPAETVAPRPHSLSGRGTPPGSPGLAEATWPSGGPWDEDAETRAGDSLSRAVGTPSPLAAARAAPGRTPAHPTPPGAGSAWLPQPLPLASVARGTFAVCPGTSPLSVSVC